MADVRAFEKTLQLRAERLCLDFVNTVNWHASAHPVDELQSYDDLVVWAERANLLAAWQADYLRQEAAQRPEAAAAVLEKARLTREALYRLLSARAHGQAGQPADVAVLNDALQCAMSHARLGVSPDGFVWDWGQSNPADLDQMLWPVVQSAVDLLTSADLARIGQCADDRGCGWLFLDTTKNRSRRWCDMRDCGNRAKARRHYARRKGEL